MPITRPCESSSGPPELPGLIEASVWITSSIAKPFGALIWRWSAETMPVVTVRVKPNGLPIAITGIADLGLRGVAERQRLALRLAGIDLDHGEVESTCRCP